MDTAVSSRAVMTRRSRRRPIGVAMRVLFGVAVGSLIVVRLLYAVFGGFKTTGQILGSAALLPTEWVTTNYAEILGSSDFWRTVLNSFVVASSRSS